MTQAVTEGFAICSRYDALLLDLDGTVYLGHLPIEHVADALAIASASGARPIYVTNNASRPPALVADQLRAMGLTLSSEDVLTSPQAAAVMLTDRHPSGSCVLVIGAAYLADEVAAAGLVPVREAAANPVAVVQGHSPETGWGILAEACIAIRAGADWVAANIDSTLPTDRGLLPGNGAMVAALVTATGRTPRVAGKPASPMIDAAIKRTGSKSPLVVGDRLDTDIEAAVNAGVDSLLVFTGVSSPTDLLAAPAVQRPTYLAFDMRGLVDAGRSVSVAEGGQGWKVSKDGSDIVLARVGAVDAVQISDLDVLHALAAVCRHSWAEERLAVSAADPVARAVLDRLDLG